MRLVVLDSGPLGMISHPNGRGRNLHCHHWARDLVAAGVRVIVPEIADYEVRRELIRVGTSASLARLDAVRDWLDFTPINSAVMLRAAELWAEARRRGRPGAPPEALDGDCILAAQALLAPGPDDLVTVATENLGHLGLFVDARPWDQIVP